LGLDRMVVFRLFNAQQQIQGSRFNEE